jgi:probable selenium-dependent hydroxylase accessory protein YqeC
MLGRRDLVALVGAGGKTSALRLLAGELSASGGRVLATTTTAMYARDLRAVGPLFVDESETVLAAALEESLQSAGAAGVARAEGVDGKLVGLTPATVDRLWARGLADFVLVEADGSKGLPLKAFAAHEPQVPESSSVVVVVAGLDVIGRPLTSRHVHRADIMAAAHGVPLGVEVTPRLLAWALAEQTRQVRLRWPGRCVVALLNKADGGESEAIGLGVAGDLLADAGGGTQPPADDRRGPDAVVVASLRLRRFVRVLRLAA